MNPQLHADTEKPDAGGAPEVLLDGRTWRDRAGTIGIGAGSGGEPAPCCCSEAVAEAIVHTETRWIGCPSRECRLGKLVKRGE